MKCFKLSNRLDIRQIWPRQMTKCYFLKEKLREKSYANLPDPMWKDYFTLNLITSCSTLGNKDFDQAFVITGNKSVTWLWKNFGPLWYRIVLIKPHWRVSNMNSLFTSSHVHWVEVWTLTRALQTFHAVFVVVGFVFLAIHSWPAADFMVPSADITVSLPGPKTAKQL